jgi:hypothetical protein
VDCTTTIKTEEDSDKLVTFVEDAILAVPEKTLEPAEEAAKAKPRKRNVMPDPGRAADDTELVREWKQEKNDKEISRKSFCYKSSATGVGSGRAVRR